MGKDKYSLKETGLEIAVIGMAGRFPKAENINKFWENLQNAKECITILTPEELDKLGVAKEIQDNPNYVPAAGGLLENKDCFDASFFDYTPREAEIMDPQFRIFHEVCWEALENSGYNPFNYKGTIGLYAGASVNFSWESLTVLSGKKSEYGDFAASQLINREFLCTRVSYRLNLKGPVVLVQSACSTSLTALHMACRALLTGECQMSLVGGVAVSHGKQIGYIYEEGMVGSPDGKCRAFDAKAKGTVFGNGAAVILLKPLRKAIADGDFIHAVVKGSALNNDGSRKVGYTAPSVKGQVEVIRAAHRFSKVHPDTVEYIETHGTGTELGDPVEVEALTTAFNSEKRNTCGIGSVKTNVGHLDAAAGATGIIKTILALEHKMLPPSLNFETSNPKIDFESSPFYVVSQLKEWKSPGHPRRAGVSSFGIGGTNAHVVLEEAPDYKTVSPSAFEYKLIPVSAKNKKVLEKVSANLGEFFSNTPDTDLADAVYTLQTGRKHFQYRKMFIASDREEAGRLLTNTQPGDMNTYYGADEDRPIIFMFSGLGSQYCNMGLELYQKIPLFTQEMDRCFNFLNTIIDEDIKEILFPPEVNDETKERIRSLLYSFPVKFSVEYSLAKLLIAWGIKPFAMIGHSFGEYVAACLSGVISLEDALKLVVLRGKLLHGLPEGAMMSIVISEEELKPLIPKGVELATVNSQEQCIVSGPVPVIRAFEEVLIQKEYECQRLKVPRAGHSAMMDPILDEFERVIGQFTLNKPQIPYISGVTGAWISVDDAVSPHYYARHLRETIRFGDGLNEILKEDNVVIVQVGADHGLSSLVEIHDNKTDKQHTLNLLRHPKTEISDCRFLFDKIGRLWLYGKDIDWASFYGEEKRYRLPLPTYPFQKQEFKIELSGKGFLRQGRGQAGVRGKTKVLGEWFLIPSWKRFVSARQHGQDLEKGTRILVFTAEGKLDASLIEMLTKKGAIITTVRVGERFEKKDVQEYDLNPRDINGYDTLFEDISKNDNWPAIILHLWNTAPKRSKINADLDLDILELAQYMGFYSLLYIAKTIGKLAIDHKILIKVFSTNMQWVVEEEVLFPELSTILGAVQVIPQEYPYLECTSIDIDLPKPDSRKYERLVENLLGEVITPSDMQVKAYRGNQCWVPDYVPQYLDMESDEAGTAVLRKNGVYLIIGGFGGMGFSMARYLAVEYKARIIITSRSIFPSRDQWDARIAKNDELDTLADKIKEIRQWEEQGAEVMVCSADVSDPKRMAEVVTEAEKHFGTINGVYHTAVVTDLAGVIQRRTHEESEAVMAPKLRGAVILDDLFKEKELDFMVLCSSLSGVMPAFGEVTYGAANIFLDAFAHYRSIFKQKHTVSIDWDLWREVGMGIDALKRSLSEEEVIRKKMVLPRGIDSEEGVRVFNRVLSESFPQLLVSFSDFSLVMKEHIASRKAKEEEHSIEEDIVPTAKLFPRPDVSTEYEAPSTETEKKLVNVFQNFLGLEVGILDDFFELGGDSLKATRLVKKVHQDMSVKLPLHELFSTPTVKQLAMFIDYAAEDVLTAVESCEKMEHYPLSYAQKGLWISSHMEKGSAAYNVPSSKSLGGEINKEALNFAFDFVMKRHENLRTVFIEVDGEARQKVLDHMEVDFTEVDFSGEENPQDVFVKYKEEDENKAFDLEKGPLLRVSLVKLTEKAHVLLFNMHHIICDGFSMGIFTREIQTLYSAFCEQREPALPELGIHYKDYVVWELDQLSGQNLDKLKVFWKDHFGEDGIGTLNLPIDKPRPRVKSFSGKNFFLIADSRVFIESSRITENGNITLYILFLAIFNIFLSKICKQENITVITGTAGRNHADLESLIGLFVKPYYFKNIVREDLTFEQFLEEVKQKSLQLMEHDIYPFELMSKDVIAYEGAGHKTGVHFNTSEFGSSSSSDRTQKSHVKEQGAFITKSQSMLVKDDLTLQMMPSETSLTFNFEYSSDIFSDERMKLFASWFNNLVEQIIFDPGRRIAEYDMVTGKEKEIFEYLQLDEKDALGIFHLSPTQRDVYLACVRDPEGKSRRVAYSVEILENVDVKAVEKAVNVAQDIFTTLKTKISVKDDLIFQILRSDAPVEFEFVDVSQKKWPEHDIEKNIWEMVSSDHSLERELIGYHLVKVESDRYIFVFDVHHIIMDGLSARNIFKKILDLYYCFKENSDYQPQYNVQVPTKDHYFNDSLRFDTPEVKKYWEEKLDGLEKLEPNAPTGAADKFIKDEVVIDNHLFKSIETYCKSQRISVSLFLKSLFGMMIRTYCGPLDNYMMREIVSSRTEETINAIGCFYQSIPLVFDIAALEGNNRLTDFFQYVRTQKKELGHRQNISLFMQHQILGQENLRFYYNYKTYHDLEVENQEYFIKSFFHFGAEEIHMVLSDTKNGHLMELFYNESFFSGNGFLERLLHVCRQVVADAVYIKDIEFILPVELQELVTRNKENYCGYPSAKLLHQIFEEQVDKHLDRIALSFEDSPMTYRELNREANKLAHYLRENKGIKPDLLVGLLMDRSDKTVIAMLAVLKAGGAYLPIDTDYPEKRVRFTLADAGVSILLTDDPQLIEKFNLNDYPVLCLPQEMDKIDVCSDENLEYINGPDHLAYIIYTSGSTGRPKGVMVQHRNLVRLFYNDCFQFDFNHEDVWTMFHSHCFDFSVWEIYGALLFGGKVVIIPKMTARDPEAYLEVLKKEAVTVLNQTPSAFYVLAESILKTESADPDIKIRWIVFGGEALNPIKLKEWRQKYPDVKVINMYGITETTVHVTYKEISDREMGSTASNIGPPIPTLSRWIMDPNQKLLPDGLRGELCIGGLGLSRGYLNRPELTEEKFSENPYQHSEKLYHTGDLVRCTANAAGDMEYLGRIDQQVQLRGFRIELGEIENQLQIHESINEAAVIMREEKQKAVGENKFLYAYYTGSGELEISQLRQHLLKELPDYMIPSFFIHLEKMPLTINGKIDYKALPDPSREIIEALDEDYEPPANETEEKIAEIWGQVLELDPKVIGRNADFFALGGNSLNIMKTKNQINKVMGLDISISLLFLHPILKELAENIFDEGVLGQLECIVKLNDSPSQTNVFIVHPRHGMVFQYKALASQLESQFNVYGVQCRGLVKNSQMPETMELMVADYVQQILQVQPEGPFYLIGFCFGSPVGYNMTKLLEELGHEVKMFMTLDEEPFIMPEIARYFKTRGMFKGIRLKKKGADSEIAKRYYELVDDIKKRELEDKDNPPVKEKAVNQQKAKVKLNINKLIGQYGRAEPGDLKNRALGIVNADVVNISVQNSHYEISPKNMKMMTNGEWEVDESTGGHNTMFESPYVESLAKVIAKHIEKRK